MIGYIQNTNAPGDYVPYEIRRDYQDQSKVLPYLYVFPTKEEETQKYIDYLNGYISQILEHIYGGSRTKFICICGILFYIYCLCKIGSKIKGMEKYIKNQNIYYCLFGEYMCVLKCIYIAVHLEEYKASKYNARGIISKLKFYYELFNKSFPVNFDGLDVMKTLEHAAKKYNIKFIIYSNDNNYTKNDSDKVCERSNHLNTIGEGENIHNLLMISGVDENNNHQVYVMYIKEIQKYTKLHICPKSRYRPPTTNHNTYKKERFEKHVNNCEGKISRSICVNEQSVPFIPHIQKNPVYAYLLSHNRSNENIE
jgi:hypothetical protein